MHFMLPMLQVTSYQGRVLCSLCVHDTQAKGVGVINASALGMGLLTPGGPPSWHPAPRGLQDACASAVTMCASRGTDASAVAIAQAVRDSRVATTLVGMCTPEEVRRNVTIVTGAFADGSAERDAGIIDALKPLWQGAGSVTWESGLPQNNQ